MTAKQRYTRRQFCKTFAKGGLAAGLFGFSTVSCNDRQRRCGESWTCSSGKHRPPNVVLIFTDDQGINDVGLYGSEISTPNMDSIGKEGIKFTDFYVAAPSCTPSRFALLTGRYQYRAVEPLQGALMPREPKHSKVHLADDEVTIADVLKGAGYRTALIGKWHLGHGSIEFGPNSHGFDEFYGFLPGCIDFYKHSYEADPAWYRNKKLIEEEGYATDLLTDEAVRFIKTNKDRPFFLYLPYNAPHYGRCPDGKFLQTPPGYPDIPEKSTDDRKVYTAMVENLDKGIGNVLAALRELNLEEDTIVIFMCDNGADYRYGGSNKPYRGQKGTIWDGGIRTACMIRWKSRIRPGQTRSQLGISLDILPTLARWTGAALPNRKLDGIDLNDIIFKDAPAPERHLFFRQKPRNQIAVRGNKWKYLQDTDGTEYLFDMTKDPYEKNNRLADDPERAAKMKAAYEKFINGL